MPPNKADCDNCKNAKPKDKPYKIFDAGGMYLEVMPNGSKYWRLHLSTRYALELLMLTFVRTSELINARWEEVDFENAQWTIHAKRMKTRQPHIVPLAKQVITILKELHEIHGHRDYVFPNQVNPRKTMSNSTILRAIYQLGYKGKVTGHGFRATAMSTIQEKLGYRYEVVDRQLAQGSRRTKKTA